MELVREATAKIEEHQHRGALNLRISTEQPERATKPSLMTKLIQ
jgi:hypothetical protein